MIRFLHAADLHLGLRVTRLGAEAGERVAEARFTALEQLRKTAAEHRADFILLAGDIFDDHSVSRRDAVRAFPILEGSADKCPVYIIPGNHDPLAPGGVWDRDPWQREQPHLRVKLLREAAPVAMDHVPVTLFPCPLRQRRSLDDPTAWIAGHPPRGDGRIRIGLAHGSLNILRLPEDDHLIRPDAADHLRLDYLALGHWHKEFRHKSADGAVRTAYSGVHEPMSFAGGDLATGWAAYAADGVQERFQDDGRGTALLVTIAGPGAAPQLETIETGRLRWMSERRDMTGLRPGELVKEYSDRPDPERTILRLTLHGVTDPRSHARLGEIRGIVENRYAPGSGFDTDAVLMEPQADQLSEAVGEGVLRRVLDRLQADAQSSDTDVRTVAGHALKLLYGIAWEDRPA